MSEWTPQNEHDSKIYQEGFDDGYDACLIEKVNSIFEDIDNLPWYHINEHGEVVQGSNSDYETFYKAKDIFDVLSKYGYEDYDG